MKKIEYIWRHLLYQSLDKSQPVFQQQGLARLFHLSSSTVNLALRPLRQLGAVKIGKRRSEVIDPEKILYHWANHHRLIFHSTLRVNLPILEIEGQLPPGSIPTAYTAIRERFGEPPADYAKIYCYHSRPETLIARFSSHITPGPANLFILLPDPFLTDPIPLVQLFVDLWNLPDWYAKDTVNFLKTKIDGLLS